MTISIPRGATFDTRAYAPYVRSVIPAQSFSVGAVVSLNLAFYVPGGVSPTYALSPSVPGLTLNASTGMLTGTVTTAQAATTMTVTVANAVGSIPTTFSMTVLSVAGKMGLPQIHTESFESFANAQNATGTNLNWSANNPGTIKVSTAQARTGTKSVLFPVQPVPPGQTLEWEFNFAALGGPFREVEFEYYIRWPTNYLSFDSPSSDNDKFFRIFGNNGAGVDSSYNTLTKLGVSTVPGSTTQRSNLWGEWTTAADDATVGFTQRGTQALNFVQPADLGVWTKINWYVKMPTALGGTGRAYLKVWKNDVLIIDERPDNYSATAPLSYYYGYLFGARNSGDSLSSPTFDFYVDDLTVFARV